MKARITERDFARMFRLPKSDIPVLARSLIGTYDLAYDFAGRLDLEEYVLNLLKLLNNGLLVRSREESRLAFERGWVENLQELVQSTPDGYELSSKAEIL